MEVLVDHQRYVTTSWKRSAENREKWRNDEMVVDGQWTQVKTGDNNDYDFSSFLPSFYIGF